MAKIKFGMMMTDARGKLGGQVFSKNRAGAYIRTKVSPVNPRTSTQMTSRSILGSLSTSWNDITDAQRESWNKAVSQWQKTDIFGDLKQPTGKNLFVRLNKNLVQSGQPSIDVAPAKVEMPEISIFTAAINTTGESVSFAGLPTISSGSYQLSATPVLSPGVSFAKNKFRVIGYYADIAVAGEAIFLAYQNKFGTVADGDNIQFQVKYIAPTGQASVPLINKAIYIP